MPQLTTRPWITAGVAVVGAGLVAVTPVTVPAVVINLPDIQLTAADMVLDLVRHGQSQDNVDGVLGTTPPGAPLTATGEQQAITVGDQLYNGGHNDIDGVYASAFLRTQQTAWPLDQLLQGNSDYNDIPAGPTPLLDPGQILPGLNELDAGFLENAHQTETTGLLYLLAPISWMFGNYSVPQLGSTIDPNGMEFETRFTDAVDQIYNNGGALADGELHDVAFSHAAAISTWVMTNVKNPDFALYFKALTQGLLPNTGQVVIEGNPTDGWTLVSWDGQDVPQTPDLLTGLLVDWRDLITVPQMALYNVDQAIAGGDPTTITAALQTGFDQVLAALQQFPQSVIDTLTGALGDATGTAGQTAGESVLDSTLASI